MKADFWLQRWERGEIGFHQSLTNPALVKYLEKLKLAKGSRIFVPLCGKTLDIAWLMSQGHQVVGVELSTLAVEELFDSLKITPSIRPMGALTLYSAKNIDIWLGDIFNLTNNVLGKVDAIYDRAALVALPREMRNRYTSHITTLCKAAPQLLITFEYNQSLYEGPPFAIHKEELQQHYQNTYQINLLEKTQIDESLKGKITAGAIATWFLYTNTNTNKP